MNKKDGGPAFPTDEIMSSDEFGDIYGIAPLREAAPGMSLRDWFAGQIASGIVTAHFKTLLSYKAEDLKHGIEVISKSSFLIADAMLREREK